jgi:hypothetical protein
MRLRAQLNLSDWDSLDQFAAFNLIPKTAVWPLKNVPGITLHSLNYFRNEGIGWSAWAVPDESGNTNVFFNDANPLREVRVHLLEECFHLRLGHAPDKISLVPVNGNYRTYNRQKEEEAPQRSYPTPDFNQCWRWESTLSGSRSTTWCPFRSWSFVSKRLS